MKGPVERHLRQTETLDSTEPNRCETDLLDLRVLHEQPEVELVHVRGCGLPRCRDLLDLGQRSPVRVPFRTNVDVAFDFSDEDLDEDQQNFQNRLIYQITLFPKQIWKVIRFWQKTTWPISPSIGLTDCDNRPQLSCLSANSCSSNLIPGEALEIQLLLH